MKIPILYIVIPCYNEEQVLPITSKEFLNKIYELIEKQLIDPKSRILFVNDGSKDATWNIIKELAAADEHYIGISQSRNRGIRMQFWLVLWKRRINVILLYPLIAMGRMISMR